MATKYFNHYDSYFPTNEDVLDMEDADSFKAAGVIIPQHIVVNAQIDSGTVDQHIFVADRAYQVTAISEVHTVAGDDASAVTLMVEKTEGTEAPGSGQDLLSSTINLKGTANTVQDGTLTSTEADLQLAAGDRLSIDVTGTLTTLAGGVVTVELKRI